MPVWNFFRTPTYNKLYIGSIWIEISAALNIIIAEKQQD